jgi:hypothetical protein
MTMQTQLSVAGAATVGDCSQAEGIGLKLRSLGQGTLLAATYGVALGIGAEGGHVLGLALAVPLTFAASIVAATPSLYVILAMLDAPMELGDLLGAATEAYRHSALVLGGLAPTLLLFSASTTDRFLIQLLGVAGLLLAASLGAYRLMSEVRLALLKGAGAIRLRHWVILLGFIGLTFELAERFWSASLSLFGGLS